MNLVLKLIIGIIAGILVGLYAPEFIVQLVFTAQNLIGQLIKFTIPLIILFYIASGIASLPKGSGSLLGKTVGLAYGSTIIAGILAFIVASNVLPELTASTVAEASHGGTAKGFIDIQITPLFDVMTALAIAFIFGIGISATNANSLRTTLNEAKDVIEQLLSKVIIPALPFYIAGVFAEMTVDGSVFSTLKTFGIVLVLALVMHWIWITVLYVTTGLAIGKSPATLLKNMLPAYFTALGTMSSAATIPVSLRANKENEVSDGVANFTVPLCASIHLSGSTITIVTCATAVMIMTPGLSLPGLTGMLGFIFMLGVTMIAAPGAPGGAVMAALGLLASMLGFTDAALALMIALYMAQDSFGTACNVTGDGAIALWVDKFAGGEGLTPITDKE
ncbi:dicarboxylate/amino acid:cation symporter [Thalassotalea sp. 1_MG-2023]|uniref:dicarboxylate/amino acid:cation symporter n=1 Tax=Thalassotalea sp. 1_MG-2023 TaxID=3062680 RepID=UPI0026E43E97|nr:dicarboxylate/amino acid:cation symporter [Thalassotalea sp. 1_MG-2023]MDO6426747.1 dicarboxylate/amino acid:cation symporter [Thalassotalea sp. 1_MG-2023]